MNVGRGQLPRALERVSGSPLTRTVPFDYVVRVPIRGVRGTTGQSLINVSTVGPFVVTGIGYSLLLDERRIPARFGPADADRTQVLPSTPTPSVAPPPAPPIVRATSARRAGSAAAAAQSGGLRVFGAPGARVQLILNGEVVIAPKNRPFQLDDRGRLQVALPDKGLTGRDTLVVNDLGNARVGPAVLLVGTGADGGGAVAATPQFGPLAPTLGATRFDLVGTPGATLEIAVRGPGDVSTPRLTLTASIPSKRGSRPRIWALRGHAGEPRDAPSSRPTSSRCGIGRPTSPPPCRSPRVRWTYRFARCPRSRCGAASA